MKFLHSNKENKFKYNSPLPLSVSPYYIIILFITISLYMHQEILSLVMSCDYCIKLVEYFNLEILKKREPLLQDFQIFDITLSMFFIYYLLIDKLPRSKKLILLILLALMFWTLLQLTGEKTIVAYHLFILFTLLPFLLNVIANHYLIDMPFWLFLNMETYTFNKVTLFTNTKGKKEHHNTDAIYIDLFFLNQEGENKELHNISKEYLRLIKFWYAYENYRFKVRYFFPILGLMLSVIIYLKSLFFINETMYCIEYLNHMSIMSIYLLILFFSINLHANNFLSSKFYMGNILHKLNQIYFDQYEYKQQVKLFLDKNFLVYIHDRNYDQELCVNTSKSFQKFISKETLDKEGRNNILTIFISFVMIFLIEVLVNVQHVQPTVPTQLNNSTKQGECNETKQ